MKKLITAGIATAAHALGASANAADLPVRPVYKAPVMAPVVYNWTGFYVGLNVGYSFGRTNTDFIVPFTSTLDPSADMKGVLGGGQIGYNWQTGVWVFGLEADIQGTGQKSSIPLSAVSTACPGVFIAVVLCPNTGGFDQKLPWFGTFRGRIGVAAAPTWLLYVTGGLAYGEVKSDLTVTSGGVTVLGSARETKAGYAVGAGTEWAFAGSNWTAKLEYLYVDLGRVSGTFVGPVAFSSRITDNIVRIGVNYRFGDGAVVARY